MPKALNILKYFINKVDTEYEHVQDRKKFEANLKLVEPIVYPPFPQIQTFEERDAQFILDNRLSNGLTLFTAGTIIPYNIHEAIETAKLSGTLDVANRIDPGSDLKSVEKHKENLNAVIPIVLPPFPEWKIV